MIKVKTLDGRAIALNAALIERVENVPETVITLVSGRKVLVEQSMDDIIRRVEDYLRRVCPYLALQEEDASRESEPIV